MRSIGCEASAHVPRRPRNVEPRPIAAIGQAWPYAAPERVPLSPLTQCDKSRDNPFDRERLALLRLAERLYARPRGIHVFHSSLARYRAAHVAADLGRLRPR